MANFVRDALDAENVHLDHVSNGSVALKTLEGSTNYDVLIVDNGLPGLSGLELVLRCKSMRHRKNMKIVMLSGDEIEREAWRAGVNEFLRKPQDVDRLDSIVTRLLTNKGNTRKDRKRSSSSPE